MRTFETFDELPGHVKADKELNALKAYAGGEFGLVGVIFQAVAGDPHVQLVAAGTFQSGKGRGTYGPKYGEQCNWIAWSKDVGIGSRRSLTHGSGKRVKFGAISAIVKKKRGRK